METGQEKLDRIYFIMMQNHCSPVPVLKMTHLDFWWITMPNKILIISKTVCCICFVYSLKTSVGQLFSCHCPFKFSIFSWHCPFKFSIFSCHCPFKFSIFSWHCPFKFSLFSWHCPFKFSLFSWHCPFRFSLFSWHFLFKFSIFFYTVPLNSVFRCNFCTVL